MSIKLVSDCKGTFKQGMEIAFGWTPGKSASGFKVLKTQEPNASKTPYEVKTLIFFWSEIEGITPLPFKMKVENAIEFAWAWLQENKSPYPKPDTDGDVEPGFYLTSQGCSYGYEIVRITPEWIAYDK